MGSSRRVAIGVALLAALATAAWLGHWSGSRVGEAAPEALPVPTYLTTAVREGVLDDALLVPADYDYPAVGTLHGNGVVTRAPAPGVEVTEGSAPFELSLKPQFVFSGERPMFRDLVMGTSGADVVQLHAALNRLGYDTDPTGSVVTNRTIRAWRAFLASHGLPAATVDRVSADQVAFMPILPATVGQVSVAVGDTAAGPMAVLNRENPAVWVKLPTSISYTQVDHQPVWLVSPVDQSLVPTTVLGRGTSADGSTVLNVQVDLPNDWRGMPLRGRIGSPQGTTLGLLVPLAAVSVAADGTATVRVLNKGGTAVATPVQITAQDRSDAMIVGNIAPGDQVIVG